VSSVRCGGGVTTAMYLAITAPYSISAYWAYSLFLTVYLPFLIVGRALYLFDTRAIDGRNCAALVAVNLIAFALIYLIRDARLLQFLAAGVDFIPLHKLPPQVPLASNAGAQAASMAEHALAMALAAANHLPIEQAEMARRKGLAVTSECQGCRPLRTKSQSGAKESRSLQHQRVATFIG
jgi:hypothetical protein